MSTVRGKQPLKLRSVIEVDARIYSEQQVFVKVRGSDTAGNWFEAIADLEPECAAELVRKLRKALRKLRDESHVRLRKSVSDAEGLL